MKHVIIGTAGHVDHGKTTLIQALTGTNPDRLKEEQERGMTIDIGFAALKLPDGTVAGIVDVPGHERFLKNMLAGASGVDVVLLVVAADESVMPQTIEHLDILRLLDVRNGVVALTKTDIADKEWTDAVEEDVRAHLQDTFLADAPILRVSAVSSKGLDALKRALQSAVSRAEARNLSLPFRLPVDRVFTRPGFGTVITGTLVAGKIRVGDAVEIVPQKIQTRVRGLQVHGQKVSEAEAGSRVAVNLAGVETEEIERGAQLAPPGVLAPTRALDAVLRLLPNASRPLKDRTRVRLHLGTAEILGRIRILDERSELAPGAQGYVQFSAETELTCARGDRFVVRTYSPMTTLGGGIVLDAAPARHRKASPAVLAALAAKERGTPEDLIETTLERCPFGLPKKELPAAAGLLPPETEQALQTLIAGGQVAVLPGERLFAVPILNTLTDRARTALEAYHKQFPLRPGMPREELRAALGRDADARAFTSLLTTWQAGGLLVSEGATVRLAGFQVELNERQKALLERIEEVYRAAGIFSPTLEEVCREVKAPPDAVGAMLRVGMERGRFVKAQEGVYYHADTIAHLQQLVRDYVNANGTITVGALRDMTQSNRKFALLVLEYFDQIRFTRRQGDERVLT
ncbi:MAG TPA: selenocysteine-specific translation elongation factor [Chthonomonadaceae bacterium]|nr:selenocysteine-specific translation elongation factor [Chthonomonadaceae bacterium]